MTKGIIIFDADGTLFDTLAGIYAALEDLHKHFDLGIFNRNDGMKYIGPPIKDSLMRYNGLTESEAEIATDYYRKVYVEKHIDMSRYYEGAKDVIVALKEQGYQIALATMKTFVQVERLFEVTGGRELFDYVENAREDGTYKKHQMIEHIRDSSRIESVLIIGDTEHDKLAAEMARVEFLGVTYGYGFKQRNSYDFPCKDSIEELVDFIRKEGICCR